jgi:hypothetical protein
MEEVLVAKVCNAFQPTAQVRDAHKILDKFAIRTMVDRIPVKAAGNAANKSISNYQRKHGGLWVGGRFFVTRNDISFSQNAMNKALHAASSDFSHHEAKPSAFRLISYWNHAPLRLTSYWTRPTLPFFL